MNSPFWLGTASWPDRSRNLTAALDVEGADAIHSGPFALASAGLGSRRVSPHDTFCLFDGDLHNRAELAGQVGIDSTAHAEEVLALVWDREGDAMLDRLRGRFALVLWSPQRTEGLIAVDPLGGGSVFFLARGGKLVFGSELRPLLRFLPTRPRPDPVGLPFWLARRGSPPDVTLFEGIRRLSAGHLIRLGRAATVGERWWSPGYRPPHTQDRSEAVTRLREEMQAALGRTAAGVGSFGLRLSGGFDSGSIAALAAAGGGARPLRAYSATFPDHPESDEASRIGELREGLGLDGVESPFRGGSALSYAAEFISTWGVPPVSPNGFVWRELLRLAHGDGIELMLDGNGGDELFGCSPYLLADLLRRGRLLRLVEMARRIPGAAENPGFRFPRRAVSVYGVRGALPPRLHGLLRRRREERQAIRPLSRTASETVREVERPDEWKRHDGPRWWAALVNATIDLPDAIGAADELRRNASLAGLRFGHPWRDPALVEHVLRLPPELAFDPVHDRALARTAMRGLLPESILLSEAKPTFNAVLEGALNGPDAGTIGALLDDPPEPLQRCLSPSAIAHLKAGSLRGLAALEAWRVVTAGLWLRHELDA